MSMRMRRMKRMMRMRRRRMRMLWLCKVDLLERFLSRGFGERTAPFIEAAEVTTCIPPKGGFEPVVDFFQRPVHRIFRGSTTLLSIRSSRLTRPDVVIINIVVVVVVILYSNVSSDRLVQLVDTNTRKTSFSSSGNTVV